MSRAMHEEEQGVPIRQGEGAPYIERGWEHDQDLERLAGAKAHLCPEWDYLAIDETWPEFEVCLCFKDANLS